MAAKFQDVKPHRVVPSFWDFPEKEGKSNWSEDRVNEMRSSTNANTLVQARALASKRGVGNGGRWERRRRKVRERERGREKVDISVVAGSASVWQVCAGRRVCAGARVFAHLPIYLPTCILVCSSLPPASS